MGSNGTGWIEAIGRPDAPRWAAVEAFVDHWYDGLRAGDGVPAEDLEMAQARLGSPLPLAVREWLSRGGAHPAWTDGDEVHGTGSPHELRLDHDHLVVHTDAEGAALWGIRRTDLEAEDPPVALRAEHISGGWLRANTTFSQFVLQMLIFQTTELAPCGGRATARPDADRILDWQVPTLPLPPWPWPRPATRFHAWPDALVIVTDGGQRYRVGCRTHQAWDRLRVSFEGRGFVWVVEWEG